MFIFSPLDQFEVVSLLGFSSSLIGNFHISLTNFGLYSLIILFIVIGLHILSNNENSLIPSKWSIFFESIYVTVLSMVKSQIGSNHEIFLPLIYSLFFFILISNLVGNITYSFTLTTSVVLTLGLSLIIFLGFTFLSISIHKFNFFGTFIPEGCPLALVPLLVLIELASYCSRAISLGVRLFSNMTAGHVLLAILSNFFFKAFSSGLIIFLLTLIPFLLFIAILVLELSVSFIQAYVFILLTCSYIKGAIHLH